VIGGYHFICVSMDEYNKSTRTYFSNTKLAWLMQELDAAVTADPTKPIFVFQHEPPQKTVVGNDVLGDLKLTALLSNYPQVIDFSGHSHLPISDSRSIWQGSFTALNAGSLAYLSTAIPDNRFLSNGGASASDTVGGYETWNAELLRNGGMYYIVEIDQNSIVRILIYDIFTQSLWGEPIILDSIDPNKFKYTNARREQSDKPVFAAGSAISVIPSLYGKVNITFPEATSKDTVQSYRVEVYENGTPAQTHYRLSCALFGGSDSKVHAYLRYLKPATQYTVKVYAVNSWAKESDPLVLNFTTTA